MPKFQSTKTYGHNLGLSCCFRQWRAEHSHCRFLHGYALEIKLVFEAEELDDRNWVVDFGGLKDIKQWLEQKFDHKTLVAHDDPERIVFDAMQDAGLIQVVPVPATGCEAFAKMIYDYVSAWLLSSCGMIKAKLVSVEVREHGANSAIYTG